MISLYHARAVCVTSYDETVGENSLETENDDCEALAEYYCGDEDGSDACRDAEREACEAEREASGGRVAIGTECKKVPRQVCGPRSCPLVDKTVCKQEVREVRVLHQCRNANAYVQYVEVMPLAFMHSNMQTGSFFSQAVIEVPKEKCSVIPENVCKPKPRLKPRVVRRKRCTDVTVDFCYQVVVDKRKIRRPMVKLVCGKDLPVVR